MLLAKKEIISEVVNEGVVFFFFNWVFVEICLFFFLVTVHHAGISQTVIKPVPPAAEMQSLNHWTSREVPSWMY